MFARVTSIESYSSVEYDSELQLSPPTRRNWDGFGLLDASFHPRIHPSMPNFGDSQGSCHIRRSGPTIWTLHCNLTSKLPRMRCLADCQSAAVWKAKFKRSPGLQCNYSKPVKSISAPRTRLNAGRRIPALKRPNSVLTDSSTALFRRSSCMEASDRKREISFLHVQTETSFILG